MADDLHLGKIALQGALLGLWGCYRKIAYERRERRIAEGRPSVAERCGWWVASLVAARMDHHLPNTSSRK
jgi:hypothetical protein